MRIELGWKELWPLGVSLNKKSAEEKVERSRTVGRNSDETMGLKTRVTQPGDEILHQVGAVNV